MHTVFYSSLISKCVCACVCKHGWRTEVHASAFHNHSLPSFLTLEPTLTPRLSGQQTPTVVLSLPSSARHMQPRLTFTWKPDLWTRVLMLPEEVLYPLSHPPTHTHTYLYICNGNLVGNTTSKGSFFPRTQNRPITLSVETFMEQRTHPQEKDFPV